MIKIRILLGMVSTTDHDNLYSMLLNCHIIIHENLFSFHHSGILNFISKQYTEQDVIL